jgi:hypothetical protein
MKKAAKRTRKATSKRKGVMRHSREGVKLRAKRRKSR